MGKFEIFEHISGDLVKISEQQNRIVYDGREATLDFLFGIETWFSGASGYDGSGPASGHWTPYRTVAVGTVSDDNIGFLSTNGWLDGGSGISGTSVNTSAGNFAHFPNLNDHYMSSIVSGGSPANANVGTGYFYKEADKIVRVGRTISIEATFTTHPTPAFGTATVIPEGTELRELGVFFGINPTGVITPSTDRSVRPITMLCRSTRYEVSGDKIIDNPITAGANDITVRYTFGDL